MHDHPIIVNTIDTQEILIHLDKLYELIERSFDDKMFYVAIFSMVITFVTSLYSLSKVKKQTELQENSLKKLSEQVSYQNEQLAQQRFQWKNDLILREKQKFIIDFRKSYILFADNMRQMISVFMPSSIGAKNQRSLSIEKRCIIPNINIEDDSDIISLPYPDRYIVEPTVLYESFHESFNCFSNFISINSIFLEEYELLYSDMLSVKRAFSFFFDKTEIKDLFVNGFSYDSERKYYLPQKNISLRYLFLIYVFRELRIERKKIGENGRKENHISSMIGDIDSPLKGFVFTDENFLKAANGEKYCFHFGTVFYTWFAFWQDTINALLKPNLAEIKQ